MFEKITYCFEKKEKEKKMYVNISYFSLWLVIFCVIIIAHVAH